MEFNKTIKSKNQKVAMVATVYRHLEAFHLPFITLLQNLGYEVHAYAWPDQGKQAVKDQGVICHDINFSRNPFSSGNVRAILDLISSFKQWNFQMIHVHTPVASVIGRLAGKIAHVPVVIYTAHGFHFHNGAPVLNWMLYYPVERLMAAFTDYLITINQEDYQRAKKFPVKKQVFFVPGVGLDLEKLGCANEPLIRKSICSELGIGEEATVISCIAELTRNKNHMQLLQSVRQIAKVDKNVHCLIIGHGQEELVLKNQVKLWDLDKHVHFLGFRRDIPELLAASDIIALLSKREGLPKSLMEAMAAGKPVVTTNVRGNRDLIIDGENGFVVPLHVVDATTEALFKLIKSPELRLFMGHRNKELVQQYDIQMIVETMANIYRQAIKEAFPR